MSIRQLLVILLTTASLSGEANAIFKLGLNPFGNQDEPEANFKLPTEEENEAREKEKQIFKVLNISAKFRETPQRNFYTMKYVVDNARIMLDDGNVVHLRGLMSGDELDRFIDENQNALRYKDDFIALNMAFLEIYLEDKNLRIKYSDQPEFDEWGDPFVTVHTEENEYVNAEVIKAGHGVVSKKDYFEDYPHLKELQQDARFHGRGVWRHQTIH